MTQIAKTENQWKPTPKQTQFLALPYSILEAFYAGAVHAGKSDVLLLYFIIHRMHENPKIKGLFLRRTFPELKNEIIPRSKLLFRSVGGKYNENDKLWRFPSGALFFFGHVENENDVHNYDSAQWNYVAFDELTSFTEWQYLYIVLERVRAPKGSGLPAIVRSGSNPGNIGHNWVRKRFIDPCPEGMRIIRGKSGIKRIFIPATVHDNPYTSDEYLQSLNALPEAEKQAKLYGKWDAYEGQVFEDFRYKKFPDEPDNALHVIPPFDIPEWWPRLVSIDWGFAPPAMTYICFAAISPSKRVFIYQELSWQKTKIEEWAAEAKVYIDKDNPRIIKMCKSAGQDRGQEHTILEQVSSALNKSVELTSNAPGSRVAGKMLLHEYFRWKPKFIPIKEMVPYNHEYAMHILRMRGLEEYKAYLASYNPPEIENNLPKLQIFDNCPLLIDSFKACIYDKTNPQDVAEFPGDDPYDAIRYLVDAADRYFEESVSEFEKVQQQEAILREYENTQDMTSFYRNAARLESTEKERPLVRYRHH